jgi:muconate cycloisomerase
MARGLNIASVESWPIEIPLARPYHLSAVLGTLTHSRAVIVRVTLANGVTGWGECDPHVEFDGYTLEKAGREIAGRTPGMIGQSVEDWVENARGSAHHGTPAAAIDVACFDALGKARGVPVWQLLGKRVHDSVDVLWPTSSGSAAEDLEIIAERHPQGFRTYMLKMGSRPIEDEVIRTREVFKALPDGVQIMVDANQGWDFDQAMAYVEGCNDLPLVLVEQPLPAEDLDGLHALRQATRLPISVDEAVLTPSMAEAIIARDAADVFSIKISKHGGLANSVQIANSVRDAGKKVLMNSMIELGITQAASLHLGVTLPHLMPCGHAYMSTLRMADDVTDFSDWIKDGRVTIPDRPGLGIDVRLDKIEHYQGGEAHVV